MTRDDPGPRLAAWLAQQLPGVSELRIEGVGRVEFGHSAEMLELTIVWRRGEDEHRRDVVVRLRPPAPGLLEPYDMRRQFDILRALEATPVRAPRALWIEESGAVLGRPFYVMERVAGEVYERELPEHLKAAPERVAGLRDRGVWSVRRWVGCRGEVASAYGKPVRQHMGAPGCTCCLSGEDPAVPPGRAGVTYVSSWRKDPALEGRWTPAVLAAVSGFQARSWLAVPARWTAR